MSQEIRKTLLSFVAHFKRAIGMEMDAMRERRGSFEIRLANGNQCDSDEDAQGERYAYDLPAIEEKLVAGMECTLRTAVHEYLVRIERIEGLVVALWCEREIDLGSGQATLVIYPWFLYEKLIRVLDCISEDRHSVERALSLFGKLRPQLLPRRLARKHPALNPSQLAAVQLCSDSDLSFVWGPPGTGKTTTLAHIVSELLAQKMRILVLSTTNAALDQALAKIVEDAEMVETIKTGNIVRIGRSDAETFGAGLRDVVIRLNAGHQESLDRLSARQPELDAAWEQCEKALEELAGADEPVQQSLFDDEPKKAGPDLAGIFNERRIARLKDLRPGQLLAMVRRRHKRLGRLRELCRKGVAERKKALQKKEQGVVDDASLVLATLTNAYFSPLMEEQRFDVVVVEEASMAILPALFYAACLGGEKTIMVGDPCQLPSIVQSDADYVRKVMGQNIFHLTVPDPMSSPIVGLLDVQYRMHPTIGRLVSELFYSGRLKHGGDMAEREDIAGLAPNPGAPLVVLDTGGRTVCRQGPGGQSRLNQKTAAACVELALSAIRSGASSVAIITPYVDQARAIRSLLKEHPEEAPAIECSTVHRFQGQERDVVILDTVDTEPMRPGVLLTEHGPRSSAQNLINVAISRARGKLVVVADVRYFKRRAPDGIVAKMIGRALAVGRRDVLAVTGLE